MDLTRLNITLETLSKNQPLILTDIAEIRKYDNENKRYLDEIEAFKVGVVAIGNGYEKFTVKVKQKPPMAADSQMQVEFAGFEAKIYRDFRNNTYALSCSADSVKAVTVTTQK